LGVNSGSGKRDQGAQGRPTWFDGGTPTVAVQDAFFRDRKTVAGPMHGARRAAPSLTRQSLQSVDVVHVGPQRSERVGGPWSAIKSSPRRSATAAAPNTEKTFPIRSIPTSGSHPSIESRGLVDRLSLGELEGTTELCNRPGFLRRGRSPAPPGRRTICVHHPLVRAASPASHDHAQARNRPSDACRDVERLLHGLLARGEVGAAAAGTTQTLGGRHADWAFEVEAAGRVCHPAGNPRARASTFWPELS